MCAFTIAATILFILILAISLPVAVRFRLDADIREKSFQYQFSLLRGMIQKQSRTIPKNKYFTKGRRKDMLALMREVMRRMRFWQVDAFVLLGMGDAARTALCCGMLDTALNAAGCVLFPKGKKGRGLSVHTTPSFDEATLRVQIHGIFRFLFGTKYFCCAGVAAPRKTE